jgi:hypothetical protein
MYKFSEYTLRPVTLEDREHAARWIAADPEHAGKVEPEFFVNPEPEAECFLLLDRWGEPIFYFKMERAVRVHIQFGPTAATKADRLRTMAALGAGLNWLERSSAKAGIRQIIFSSTFQPLIRYCKNKLGFRESASQLLRGVSITREAPPATEKSANTAADYLQERQTSHVRSH